MTEGRIVWPELGWCWDLPVLSGPPCRDRRYGPQTPALLALLSWVERLTPDQVAELAVAHRRWWLYGVGEPAHHPARQDAWWALRSALDRAGRVLYPDLGPVWLAARTAALAARAGEALWPVLDAAMATCAVDLVDTVPGWHADAYVNLMSPWLDVVEADLVMFDPAGARAAVVTAARDGGVAGPSGVVWAVDELAAVVADLKASGRGRFGSPSTVAALARVLERGRAARIVVSPPPAACAEPVLVVDSEPAARQWSAPVGISTGDVAEVGRLVDDLAAGIDQRAAIASELDTGKGQ